MAFPPYPGYTQQLYEGVRLSQLLTTLSFVETDHLWRQAAFGGWDAWNMAALWLAAHITSLRCGGARTYFSAWIARLEGGAAHAEGVKAELEAYLSESIGTPDRAAPKEHFQGLIVEHIWHALANEQPGPLGPATRVEDPSWSSTDSGGDGLAVYRQDGELAFRLWESKWHTARGPARTTANRAAQQLSAEGMRYLARWSKVGQNLDDPEMAAFYARLVELWRQGDQRAGGGVAIATPPETDIAGCFAGLAGYWLFTDTQQREGLLAVVRDIHDFADEARWYIWKGL